MPTRRRNARTLPRIAHRKAEAKPTVSAKAAMRVLVATDGSRAAGAAIKFASGMADLGLWQPEVVTVIEHLPIAIADVALPVSPIISEPELMQGILGATKRQLRRFGGTEWTLRVQFGGAAPSIVDQAKESGAKLIVLGLGHHGRLARLFGAETAARVCRLTDIPVIAVESRGGERRWTAIVAMDFGESSVRAAREALGLLAPGSRLHLLHVRWALDGQTLHDPAWERTYAMGVEQGFARLQRELATDGIKITWELRLGGVIKTILAVAKELGADLIAAGSHSQNVIDRLLIGSTPALLLRAAKCSMLIVPPQQGGD